MYELNAELTADAAPFAAAMRQAASSAIATGRALDQLAVSADRIDGSARRAGRAVDGLDREVDQSHRTVERYNRSLGSTGRLFAGLGVAAVAARAVRGLRQELDEALQAASGLEQALGATQTVFGSQGDAMVRYAQGAADLVGLSQRAALEGANRIGGALQQVGLSAEEARLEAQGLLEIAADLTATYGGTVPDALDALIATFRGEFDPAERLNINLNMTLVTAKAVAMGLAETTSQVDRYGKVLATLALIQEQAAPVTGQFGRELDTAAGAAAVASARMEDARARLGEALLPVSVAFSQGIVDRVVPALETLARDGGKALEDLGSVAADLAVDAIETLIELLPRFMEMAQSLMPILQAAAGAAEWGARALELLGEAIRYVPDTVLTAGIAVIGFSATVNRAMRIIGVAGKDGEKAFLSLGSVASRTIDILRTPLGRNTAGFAAGVIGGWQLAELQADRTRKAVDEMYDSLTGGFDLDTGSIQDAIGHMDALRTRANQVADSMNLPTFGNEGFGSVDAWTGFVGSLFDGDPMAEYDRFVEEFNRGRAALDDLRRSRAEALNAVESEFGLSRKRAAELADELGINLYASTDDVIAAFGEFYDRVPSALEESEDAATRLAGALGLTRDQLDDIIDGAREAGAAIGANLAKAGDLLGAFDPDARADALAKVEAAQGRVTAGYERIAGLERDLADVRREIATAPMITEEMLRREQDLIRDIGKARGDAAAAERELASARAAVRTDEQQIADIQRQRVEEARQLLDLVRQGAGQGLDPAFLLRALEQGVDSIPTLETILGSDELVGLVNATEQQVRDLAAEAEGFGTVLTAAVHGGVIEAGDLAAALDIAAQVARGDLQAAVDGIASGLLRSTETAEVLKNLFGDLAGHAERLDQLQAIQAAGRVTAGIRGVLNRIWPMRHGGVIDAHVTRTPTVLYGERETGGEAFVPRNGRPERALSTLATAAAWYGHRIIPMRHGGILGASPTPHSTAPTIITTTSEHTETVDQSVRIDRVEGLRLDDVLEAAERARRRRALVR